MDPISRLLDFALAKEEEAAAFYAFLASAARRQHIRTVFEELANQEKAHKKVFEKLVKEGCRLKTEKGKKAQLLLSNYLVDIPFDPEMSYQDALILGMKREEKSRALYLDFSRKVDDPCLAETLRRLADEEAAHKARLETLYDKEVLTED